MSKLLSLLAIGILAFAVMHTIRHTQTLNYKYQLKEIEVQTKDAQIKTNQERTEQLLKDLDRYKGNDKKYKETKKKLQEQERENKRLQEELQAKREARRLAALEAQQSVLSQNVYAEPQPSQTASTGDIEQIVRDAATKHGLDPNWFVQLAMCESTMNPNAVNYNYSENGNPSGMFQHLSGYWHQRAIDHGYAGASVFDPVANANVTASMIATGSRGLWEC